MTSIMDFPQACAVDRPASRRFYVHVGSFGFLVAAQPSIFPEIAGALALSGASRALDQAVQDWTMFAPVGDGPSPRCEELADSALALHKRAADELRTAFQCVVQLVPPRFGTTDLLLGASEQISAWCYEDGYLTYATDDDAAAIMYTETGSLRELRSQIRRSPDFDPALEMISGHSLFLYDQKVRIGNGTAKFYKQQAARLLRGLRPGRLPVGLDPVGMEKVIKDCVSPEATTFDGEPVLGSCLRRANLMVTTLLRSLPA
jgi:hypothetical protein